jgi:Ead/Ea22-like protein
MTHDELRALALAATPGEWHVRGVSYPERAQPEIYADNRKVARINNSKTMPAPESDRNADYIAAANPATVLALLDDLSRIRAAARAFAEARTEAALLALMDEVER